MVDVTLSLMSSPRLTIGRVVEPGAYYVVTTVTCGRAAILDKAAAECVADEIRQREHAGWVLNISWVVMPDHLHWLFELRQGDLGGLMCNVKSLSARRICALRMRQGAVWQPGYYDHRIRQEEDLHAQARYIQQNPSRSGLIAPGERYPHAWCRYLD